MDLKMKKTNYLAQMSMVEEIAVVNFAGGGGSCDGIERYTELIVSDAVNHDPAAILMHKTNHPYTIHHQEDVFAIDPVKVCQGRPVALAWFSPDCTHFSRAKGGTPVKKEIRGLSWVIVRWAMTVRPRIIMMENVKEIRTWGPLIERNGAMYPDPAHKGETFEGFVRIMTSGIEADHPALLECCEFLHIDPGAQEADLLIHGLGYEMDWKELCAADFGVPTTRERFFGVFRNDRRPICWPEATHAKRGSPEVLCGKKKPWVGANTIIDWSLPAPSIFSTKKEIKALYHLNAVRPLAENTMRRIARGLDKFVLKDAEPYIVEVNHSGEFRGQAINDPLSTVTAKHGRGLVRPLMAPFDVTNTTGSIGTAADQPIHTITSVGNQLVAEPIMVPYTVTNTTNATGTAASDPLNTVRTGGGGGQTLVTPLLACICQNGGGDRIHDIQGPVPTIVSKAETCLVSPFLAQYHQEQSEDVRGQSVSKPIMTLDGANRYGMVAATMVKYYGNDAHGQEVDEPLHTITSKDREGVIVANITKFFGGGYAGSGADMKGPLPTITATDHNAVELAHICKFKGENLGQHPEAPLHTVTATAGEFAAIHTRIMRCQQGADLGHWPEVRAMLNTWCGYDLGDDEVLVRKIGNDWWYIYDVGLRMLTAREAYNAQGFAADYIIDHDYLGHPYPKTEQMAKCGNAADSRTYGRGQSTGIRSKRAMPDTK